MGFGYASGKNSKVHQISRASSEFTESKENRTVYSQSGGSGQAGKIATAKVPSRAEAHSRPHS